MSEKTEYHLTPWTTLTKYIGLPACIHIYPDPCPAPHIHTMSLTESSCPHSEKETERHTQKEGEKARERESQREKGREK